MIEQELIELAERYIKSYGLDRKNLNLVKELNSFDVKADDDGEQITISGYLSTFRNVDRQNDVVKKGAFDEAIKGLKKLPMLRDHRNSVDYQLGSFTTFKVDSKGLYVEGKISKTAINEHTRKLIEDGHLDTLSMGGLFRYDDRPNKNGNSVIAEVFLLEGSVVSIPANPKATFTMKSMSDYENDDLVDDESKDQQVSRKVADAIELIKSS